MRYLRPITRQRPAAAQFDTAFQKVSLVTAVAELFIFLRDGLGLDFPAKEDENGS